MSGGTVMARFADFYDYMSFSDVDVFTGIDAELRGKNVKKSSYWALQSL